MPDINYKILIDKSQHKTKDVTMDFRRMAETSSIYELKIMIDYLISIKEYKELTKDKPLNNPKEITQ
ncbi:MAG: hypothetical protein AABW56_01485 [Nanoarchaeota archaeon]